MGTSEQYYKNCSSPKDITHIKNGSGKLIVTEKRGVRLTIPF